MPIPRRLGLGRRGWTDDDIDQLIGGWDYGCNAWGMLSELPDDELRTAIEEMGQCYRECRERIQERLPYHNRTDTPWFEKYAADPHALFVENHKARSYMEYQHANKGYRPYEEFEQQYIPPAEAPTAGVDSK